MGQVIKASIDKGSIERDIDDKDQDCRICGTGYRATVHCISPLQLVHL